jgi:hypothetical protein
MIPLGGALLGFCVYTLQRDRTFYPKAVVLGCALVLMGILGIIDPRLLNAWHPDFSQQPNIMVTKVISVIAIGLIIAASFYPLAAMEWGWWLPEEALKLING